MYHIVVTVVIADYGYEENVRKLSDFNLGRDGWLAKITNLDRTSLIFVTIIVAITVIIIIYLCLTNLLYMIKS